MRSVRIGAVAFGKGRLSVIAGPCVLEDPDHAIRHAEAIGAICDRLSLGFVFKASFDKANRTSLDSYRGPGLEDGLAWLARVRSETGRPVLTDIHEPGQAKAASEFVDALQIPAFLCRQTDLCLAAGRTGLPVNIKKAQFLAPGDMAHPLAKVRAGGSEDVLLTERGNVFGYRTLVVDMAGLPELRSLGAPVLFDATHSVQRPGGEGDRTGGDRSRVLPLASAAAAAGIDGLFLEVHENPDRAPSDGPNMVPLADLETLLERVLRIHEAASGP